MRRLLPLAIMLLTIETHEGNISSVNTAVGKTKGLHHESFSRLYCRNYGFCRSRRWRDCLRAIAGNSARKDCSASRFGTGIVKSFHGSTSRELDHKAVGSGEEEMGQGQGKMGRLPEAV